MSVDSAVSIAWDVLKWVAVPIKRQFGYVIFSNRFANDLREEVQNLNKEVERVNHLEREATYNVRNFHRTFVEWKESAEKDSTEAQQLLDAFDEESKTCCYGTLPNPKSRYQFSRNAKGKITVIKRLAQKCSGFKECNDISSPAPALGDVGALDPARREHKDADRLASRELIMRKIMDALADKKNSVVGIYGMGGVGKSTLMLDLKKRLIEEKSFDWVAMAEVSQYPDIWKIQGEIAAALGFGDIEKEVNVNVRAGLLQRKLEVEESRNKKVLIVLDNLWERLDLKTVGIPCGYDNRVRGCKLFLSSRDQNLLQMQMCCEKDFSLDALNAEEAKGLFERTVGDKVRDDSFKPLVDKALRKCGGLPFVIVAMANLFRNADLPKLEDALEQIEKSTGTGISGMINETLQWSYNYFKDEEGKQVKSLLRLCVLYGVPKPSLEDLVRYGVGLKLFGEDTSMKAARNRLSSLVQTLRASSLLLHDKDGDGFKIHDLVRGFVASVASRDEPFLVLKDNEKLETESRKGNLKSCTAVCFPYVDMKELPQELDCPEMQIFLLFANNQSLKVPDSYFNSMRKLMVLHLSQVCITRSPSAFQSLENLHTLCLDRCSIEDVAMIGKLKRLHVLSFAYSSIQRLPNEIGQLEELRSLDLSYCSELKVIDPGVLGCLTNLEELYMESSFDRWNDMEQTPSTGARLIELNNMKNLCTLHVSIPDPSVLPPDLNLKNLIKYEIKIGAERLWRWWPDGKGTSILQVNLGGIGVGGILQKGSTQTLLGKTDDLILKGLNGIEQSICALSQEGFSKLKHLDVWDSPSIHHILQSPSHTSFRRLESLYLENLINLEKICGNDFSSESFSALKVVRVKNCNKLEVLFPLSLLRQLPQLEEIHVMECRLMRGIVEVDDCGKVELSNLHVLVLDGLPNVNNFCTVGSAPSSSTSNNQVSSQVAFFNGQQIAFPNLEILEISGMGSMERIWDDQVAAESFHKLKSIRVHDCDKLVNIVPSSCVLEWLRSLENLEVTFCGSLEAVFKLQPVKPLDGHVVAPFPLQKLKLYKLPELKRVWDVELHNQVKFQCLRSFTVRKCRSLASLFPTSVAMNLIQLEEMEIEECGIVELIENEGLVPTDVFPRLTTLELMYLTELKCICARPRGLRWPALKTLEVNGCDKVEIFASHNENGVPLHKQPLFLMDKVAFPNLKILGISGMGSMERIWDDQVAVESFHKLKSLYVYRCNKLVNIVPSSCVLERLRSLENLEVRFCGSLEAVFKLQPVKPLDGHVVAPFPLQKLKLYELPELKCVWDVELHNQVKFQCLRFFTVRKCKSLASLFPTSVAMNLIQLEKLKIEECGIVELIENEGPVPTDVFPRLTSLKLTHVTELKCICARPRGLRWPALKTLEVNGCDKVEIFASHHENGVPLHKQPLFLMDEVAFPSLERIEMYYMASMERIWDDQVAAESFHKLKSLCVDNCDKLVNIVPSSCVLEQLKSLENLKVNSCGSLEAIFKLQPVKLLDGHVVAPFPLQKLELYKLPELKHVWDVELHNQVKFQCLRSFTVRKCWSLASLFPASVAMNLIQLEEMEIKKCGIVELIENEGLVPTDVFPRLTSLKLEDLTELKCICARPRGLRWPALKTLEVNGCDKVEIFASHHENGVPLHKQPLFLMDKVAFPNLERLEISGMGSMERIWDDQVAAESFHKLKSLYVCGCDKLVNIVPSSCVLERLRSLENLEGAFPNLQELILNSFPISMEIWHRQFHDERCFRHIKTLDVSRCEGLSKLFISTIARNLVELTELRISNCKMLTEIICEEGGEEELVLVFNQLKYIELKALRALRCFSLTKYSLKFPLLEDVIVKGCPRMKFFSRGLIEAPKLERVQVSTHVWFWTENLNITIQNMFEEMVTIVGEKFLQLSEFPELIGPWHSKLSPIKSSYEFELKALVVDKCPSIINGIPSKLMLGLGKMEKVQVLDCESQEEIFDLEGLEIVEGIQVLPLLMDLNLVNLPKLKRLWNKDLQGMMRFNFLQNLTLYNCSNLRHALGPSMAQCLPNLCTMEIKECGQMEGVIVEEEGRGSEAEKITFLKLQRIKLEGLPNLTSFLSGTNRTLDCPEMNYLTIAHCPKMKSLTRQTSMDSEHGTPSLFTPQLLFPRLEEMVLSHMDNLRKIWMDSSQDPPAFKDLQKVEVENCKQLENLFPYWMATNLEEFKELRVESCRIENVVANEDDTSHSIATQILFPELTSLVLHDMPQLKSFCPTSPTLNCPILEELRVTHCDKLKMLSFADSMNKWAPRDDQHDLPDHEAHSLFDRGIPTLEKLLLVNEDIQKIQNGKFPDDIFDKPKALALACFHDENAFFPPRSFLQRFQNLESLEIYCCSFEDIFPYEVLVDEGKHRVLENLEELKLNKLHNLKHIWREDYLAAKILQSIDILEVWDCPGLTTLFPIATSFWNLTKLVVKNSSGLVHLVTISALKNLVHLADMTVIGCERMKEVVANDGDCEGRVISVAKLRRLTLEHLPSLECFASNASCSFRFPILEQITVEECPKMKIFSKGIVSTPGLRDANLFRYKWYYKWEGDLNTKIQTLSA